MKVDEKLHEMAQYQYREAAQRNRKTNTLRHQYRIRSEWGMFGALALMMLALWPLLQYQGKDPQQVSVVGWPVEQRVNVPNLAQPLKVEIVVAPPITMGGNINVLDVRVKNASEFPKVIAVEPKKGE